jgi:hypothetical protein
MKYTPYLKPLSAQHSPPGRGFFRAVSFDMDIYGIS